MQPEYKEYQKQVLKNAKAMCSALLARGYKVVSGNECHKSVICLTISQIYLVVVFCRLLQQFTAKYYLCGHSCKCDICLDK